MISKVAKLIKDDKIEDAKIAGDQVNQLITAIKKEDPNFNVNRLV